MIKITNLTLHFDHDQAELEAAAVKILGIKGDQLVSLKVLRRSLDARRGRPLQRVYSLLVKVADQASLLERIKSNQNLALAQDISYLPVMRRGPAPTARPLVVGSGPAGIFSALILAEAGLQPIVLERGKDVQKRSGDTHTFWETGLLDPESNVQFGEGGAGTFSDGKLQTRVKDKSNRDLKVLQELVEAGAPEEILYEHKPHIGTANLVRVVKNLREKITGLGGEYRFCARVDDLLLKNGQVTGVILAGGEEILSPAVILAIGHSARDTFEMLHQRGMALTPKPFSVGFRIEHPQAMIDLNQYGKHAGNPGLGAADYQLAYHSPSGRTVYSFCMCPGGQVIAAASEPEGLVTNGMSQYARDGLNANSAIVAEVYPGDFEDHPLGGIWFQRQWERAAFQQGGSTYHAPVQLLGDFLAGKASAKLGLVVPSYLPGFQLRDLSKSFPERIVSAIKEAVPEFNKRIRGFSRPDAVLAGVETRTSAPLRMLRDGDHQSIALKGLFPAGEGSGYAGGIMSSAMDGIKTSEKVIGYMAGR